MTKEIVAIIENIEQLLKKKVQLTNELTKVIKEIEEKQLVVSRFLGYETKK